MPDSKYTYVSVSIVLPVYNGMPYLEDSVNSVLKQTYPDFEFLIGDDCSTDGSYEWIQQIRDERIRIFRNDTNRGLFFTLNSLCREAKGKLIKIWTQDDVMRNDCLEQVLHFHTKYPQISFSYSERKYIDEQGNEVPSRDLVDFTPEWIPRELHDKIALYTGSIAGNISNVTIVNEKLKAAGYFDESMKIGADFDMWVKLTQHDDIGKIQMPIVFVRYHKGQLSRSPDYYLNHLMDDKKVYSVLFTRVDKPLKIFGKKSMLWRKNILYFSFFLKALFSKNWKTARAFYHEISEIDNFIFLAVRWVWVKFKGLIIKKQVKDNRFLFDNKV